MQYVNASFSAWCIGIALFLVIVHVSPEARAQSAPAAPAPDSQPVAASTVIDFDHFETGPVPPEEFTSVLRGRGRDASWEIRPAPSAVSGRKVLVQTNYDQIDFRFPLLLYNNLTAKNVHVTVQFKQVSGKIDQSAGIIARFQDPEHFYVVRANAPDDTVQLYRVVKGERQVIAEVTTHVASDQWHSLEIRAQDDHFTISLDGQHLFNARDTTLVQAGKVGLSTKSDGVTIFDDLQITVLDQPNARS